MNENEMIEMIDNLTILVGAYKREVDGFSGKLAYIMGQLYYKGLLDDKDLDNLAFIGGDGEDDDEDDEEE